MDIVGMVMVVVEFIDKKVRDVVVLLSDLVILL